MLSDILLSILNIDLGSEIEKKIGGQNFVYQCYQNVDIRKNVLLSQVNF